MIAPPTGVRVYLACGYTDMRRGMQGLAMQVQQVLVKNPFEEGTVYAFRGRRGNLLKVIWHDGIALCTRPVHLAHDMHWFGYAVSRGISHLARRLRVARDGSQSAA